MLIDLTALGLITVTGPQSAEFLQGQVSCDVQQVTAKQSRLGVYCTPKGRVLATFRLFYVHPNYYLLLPREMVALAIGDLKKYAIFYKIQLASSEIFAHKIGLSGDNLGHVLKQCGFTTPMRANEVHRNHVATILNIPDARPRAILLSEGPTPFSSNIEPFDYWQQLDIESGLASIYPTSRELFTPHQLYYHQREGISFTKGCYTGQDVIARMQYLGQLKNKLYHVSINTPQRPQAGQFILDADDAKLGTLIMTTIIKNDSLSYEGLASIQNTALGKPLYINQVPLSILKAV